MCLCVCVYIYIYIHIYSTCACEYFFFIIRVKACAIPCPHQPPTRSDNTVLVAQDGTATPGTTKQLLPPYRVFKRIIYIYIYIYTPDQLKAEIILLYWMFIFIFSVQFGIFKKHVYFWPLISLCVYRNRFLMIRNHTGMVVLYAFHSCWKFFTCMYVSVCMYVCVYVQSFIQDLNSILWFHF